MESPTRATRCLPRLKRRERTPRKCREFCRKWRLPRHFWVLLHAVNLQHGTDGFTFPPKEGVLRIFSVLITWSIICYVSVNGETYSRILNEVVKRYLDDTLLATSRRFWRHLHTLPTSQWLKARICRHVGLLDHQTSLLYTFCCGAVLNLLCMLTHGEHLRR